MGSVLPDYGVIKHMGMEDANINVAKYSLRTTSPEDPALVTVNRRGMLPVKKINQVYKNSPRVTFFSIFFIWFL